MVDSGFGAECEQLDEGAKESVQPALVGHALLHHFLLARVLSCLFNGVGLEKWDRNTQTVTPRLKSGFYAKRKEYTSWLCAAICASP